LRLVSITKTENRIRMLQEEKENIMLLIKNAQHVFYRKHFITKSLYDVFMQSYQKRIGDIEISLIRLKLKEHNHKARQSIEKEAEHQKKEIINLIKKNQENYFVKKIIDFNSFDKLETIYNEKLAEVEHDAKTDSTAGAYDKEKKTIQITGQKHKSNVRKTKEIHEKKIEEDNVRDNEFDANDMTADDLDEIFDLKDDDITDEKIETSEKNTKNVKNALESDKSPNKIGPEDVFIDVRNAFHTNDGKKLHSIARLSEELGTMDDHVFSHHVTENRNDFAEWVKDVFRESELSEKLRECRDKSQMQAHIDEYLKKGGSVL
ncbi:MAG: hypothetical protein KKF44_09955, partial [Nanoarchaeota archaeon]|nr:hypothetical protein [Nanoarchaeota archaeon]